MSTILVVDDERNYRWMLQELLREEGFEVVTCEKGIDALACLRDATIDVLLTDLRMAEMDGLVLLEKAREVSPATSALLMTAYGTIERAVEAMRRGAYDFIVKPFENADLIRSIRRAIDRTALIRENVRLAESLAHENHSAQLIGRSAAIKATKDKILRVKEAKSAVLISGESGTGKELVARTIHFTGVRRGRPFIAINCSALTDTLAESELFGHEKGAFTGANARHLGLFEQADGGTLFLDEIGELAPSLQSKLLRALDTNEIRRVGAEKSVPIDVRVLSATNRDLQSEIRRGTFRQDLFFRLSVVRIDVPALRERHEDIPLLAEACLKKLTIEHQGEKRLAPAAIEALVRYRWPGNVRELHNVITHAFLMAEGDEIALEDFPMELATTGQWEAAFGRLLPENASLNDTLKAVEHHLIARALARSGGVQAKAAELLNISRSLLQYKLKTFVHPPETSG